MTIVLARGDFLESGRKDLPKILQYRTHAEARSLLNTPPTFGIYLMRNAPAQVKSSRTRGSREEKPRQGRGLYAVVDQHAGFYRCPVEPRPLGHERRLPAAEQGAEKDFVAAARAEGMLGLKGHRSVGGIRASLYNAVEPEWVSALASFMKAFAKRSG